MPYTPPSQRSPAASTTHSPNQSRRSSYQAAGLSSGPPQSSGRPDLPRSASYLTRHRRTPSVKTTQFATATEDGEPTPPGTADQDKAGISISPSNASKSVRQSPPPTGAIDAVIPPHAIISPPDSAINSSDDEELGDILKKDESRGREINGDLARLTEAIRLIEQKRESSPNRTAADVAKANQQLSLIMPDQLSSLKPTTMHLEKVLSPEARKISHSRSHTESALVTESMVPSQSETPVDSDEDEDDLEMRHRKPPMLRKKSGELVRPALRPSSSRRRPSSMPGTPTYSKAVHFDSHLEHVRHFLQVDRPLAVSAGSSPTGEHHDSDSEFPFEEDESYNSRSPSYEWEIVVSNFPADTPERLRLPVRVERVFLSADNKTLIGSIAVANLAFNKFVVARFTLDYWKTTSEVIAEYNNDVRRKQNADGFDRFNFNIKLADQANLEAKTLFFCVKYSVNGTEYWDNNNSINFQVDFKKKQKAATGKKATAKSAGALPRSNKKSPTSGRPRAMATFDDFAHGFEPNEFGHFSPATKPTTDFLDDDSNTTIRLKGVRSAVNITSNSAPRKPASTNSQAFGHRYDFGASLSAAIQAANTALGDRSGLSANTLANAKRVHSKSPKFAPQNDAPPSAKASQQASIAPTPSSASSNKLPATNSTSGPTSTAPASMSKQSYDELLDKYCFFGSAKSSPQMRDGTLGMRSGQYDGNDDGYILKSEVSRSVTPSPPSNNSPQMAQTVSAPAQASNLARSTSPAPMTGFATGTSSVYPYQMHGGFSFNDAHTPTAIRG